MTCSVTYEELAAFACDDLPPERRAELRRHTGSCATCAGRLEALSRADARLAGLGRDQPDAGLLLRTRRALSRVTRPGSGPEIMTLDEVAEFLRVPAAALEDVAHGLPAFEFGGHVRVRRASLLRWIEERERAFAQGRVESDVAAVLAGL